MHQKPRFSRFARQRLEAVPSFTYKTENLIVGWCGRFLFFVVPRQFSQVVGEWPENQILIPDWTYFHCPGTTLVAQW